MNVKAPSGPENMPIREYVKSFPMTVSVFNEEGKLLRSETVDYSNYEHRKWIGRVTYWACSEGYKVETKKA